MIGDHHTALGSNSIQLGQYTYDEAQKNAWYFSSGGINSGSGSAQTSLRILRATTVGSARLTGDQGIASTTNSYLVNSSTSHNLSFRVIARDTTNGDTAVWKVRGGIATRTAGGNVVVTTDTIGAPDFSTGAASTASYTVTADTTLQTLNFTATDPTGTGHIWDWQVVLNADQVI